MSKLNKEIEDLKMNSRLSLYDRVKWITANELIRRQGSDMSDIERELILTNEDIMYPVNE